MAPTPPFECDLVLKGGVTSALVHPSAVVEIARDHRLRSVGGSSAGAIAAALAAAAEVGREHGGFEALAAVPVELVEQDARGRTLLLRLFQPQPGTRGTFAVLRLLQETSGSRRTALLAGVALRRGLRTGAGLAAVLATLAVAVVLALATAGSPDGTVRAVALVAVVALGALATALTAAVAGTRALARSVPAALAANQHGLCSGLRAPGDPDPALSEWVHARVQSLAGADPGTALTHGDLVAAGVVLVTTTTNVSQGTALEFPFGDDQLWAYRSADLARVLPVPVLQALDRGRSTKELSPRQREALEHDGLRLLPDTADLPVLLGVRLSLSFPVLLSAVPLHTWAAGPDGDPGWARCWLSDGGITSNLPVHLFDSPVPRRPTYAVNLSGGGDARRPPAADVWRPRRLDADVHAPVRPGDRTQEFLLDVYDTLRNWSDESLARAPGMRERVCTVRLADGEGGLNLSMSPRTVLGLAARGTAAGADLASIRRDGPVPDPGAPVPRDQWNEHRFLRLRCFLAGLGLHVEDAREALTAADTGTGTYPDLSRTAAEEDWFPGWGPWTTDRARRAQDLLEVALRTDTRSWWQDPPPFPRLRRDVANDADRP